MKNSKNLQQISNFQFKDTFRSFIDHIGDIYCNRNAFIIKEKKSSEASYKYITYKQFQEDVNALAAYLTQSELILKPIAIMGLNSYPWFLLYCSILYAGGTCVPLDKELHEIESLSSIKRSYSGALFYHEKTSVDKYVDSEEILKNVKLYTFDDILYFTTEGKKLVNAGYKAHLERTADPHIASIILFTSGTTSNSKAVLLTQYNVLFNAWDANITQDAHPGDVTMAFLPYHHSFGATGQVFAMTAGLTTTYCDGLKYIKKNIQEYKVSIFFGVPALNEGIYKKIIAEAKKKGMYKKLQTGLKLSGLLRRFGIDIRRRLFSSIHNELGGSLRLIINGASAIDPNVLKGLNDLGIVTIQGYGLTEAAPMLTAENAHNMRLGSVGKAMPHVELKLVDKDENGIGQLIAKSPCIMQGYFENTEETQKVLKDGWLYTGDLATIDDDGFVFIKGRAKNVIVLKNGKNVFPEEIESLITSSLDYIDEIMIFGDQKGSDDGNVLVAAKIVYNEHYMTSELKLSTNEDIHQYIKNDIDRINETMPVYKQIKRIITTNEPMIKTTTGKIKRFKEVNNLQQ